MTSTSFARLALVALLAIGLAGCKTTGTVSPRTFAIEHAPKQYERCVHKAVTQLPAGAISYKEAQSLMATLRESELYKDRCGKGLYAWGEAQYRAYAKAAQ